MGVPREEPPSCEMQFFRTKQHPTRMAESLSSELFPAPLAEQLLTHGAK